MAAAQEWFMAPRVSCYTYVAHELSRRLKRAVSACGYNDEAGAVAYVGEEFMAIAHRLTDGWAAICASPDKSALRAIAFRLAHHLWAVKSDGVAPLAPQDRARRAAEATATRGFITGKQLLLTLAAALGNDADLVPIAEARHLRADRDEATRIAQEMYQQWIAVPSMPKATFRSVLARRLRAAGGR